MKHLKLPILAALACAGVALAAESTPIRLLEVAHERNALVIKASEPVAYAVTRPDPLTLVLELRNVTVADAANHAERRDLIAGVALEQATAIDGAALARVRVKFTRPAVPKVYSARNHIWLQFSDAPAGTAGGGETPGAIPVDALVSRAAAAPPSRSREAAAGAATVIESVTSRIVEGVTTITLSGNGRLTPSNVTETTEVPRRLVLDFADLTSQAPAQTAIASPLVTRVRVALNSRSPLITRVVMEIAAGATYHIDRAGTDAQDLAVIFERTTTPSTAGGGDASGDLIPLPQAIANAASITAAPPSSTAAARPTTASQPVAAQTRPAPSERMRVEGPEPVGVDPMAALKTAPPAATATQAATTAPPPSVTPPAAQQTSAPGSSRQIGPGGQKKYVGTPITLDFSGADLRSVLRIFAEPSGLNILIDPEVPSTPQDFLLKDIPWDQAMEIVLRSNQLGYEIDGTVIRIAPLKVLENEQKQRASLTAAQALAGTPQVRTFSLSYAKAESLSPLLVKSTLSQRGQIQVDVRTNTLIITDLPERLQTTADLIATLDRPEPQVEVEARIVQTTRDFARALGIQWGINGRMTPDIGNTTNLAFPNRGTLGGRLGTQGAVGSDPRAVENDQTGSVVNLGVPAPNTAIGLALGAVNGAFNLDVALSALESSGKGRVLSTPRLTTQNNVSAEIAQGIEIPIQTVSNNTVIVTFKDATLKLIVTPQITAANTVIMQIEIQNATPDFSREVNGIPPIDTQRANTRVQVDDGATTVIGGIFVSREQASSDRTPLLSRIPLLGWLFRRESVTDESRELLIFITPRIHRG